MMPSNFTVANVLLLAFLVCLNQLSDSNSDANAKQKCVLLSCPRPTKPFLQTTELPIS